MIHQLSAVDKRAKIGKDVVIEAFTTISADVEIGDGTWIGPNVTIMDGARIGKNCRVFPGAVISAIPQDLKFDGEDTQTYIGDHTTIRECVTVNRGTKALGYTKVGENCLIMATAHVAHDCIVGNNVIIANGCAVAGHVEIDDFAVIGGLTAIQQFSNISKHTMIAGGSLIKKDVPPFIKAGKEPTAYVGINTVGLRRRGFTNEKINEIQNVYRIIYQSKLNVSQAVQHVEETMEQSEERDEIINFIKNSPRGIIRGYSKSKAD